MSKKIDLSDIKENDIDKTITFIDKKHNSKKKNIDDIEEMINEEKKETKDLTIELKDINKKISEDNDLEKTKTFEIPKEEQLKKKEKKKVSRVNIIGEINILCIGYYAYLILFSSNNYRRLYYLVLGISIIFSVLVFGLSSVSNNKLSKKVFNILNIISILFFISFSIFLLIK